MKTQNEPQQINWKSAPLVDATRDVLLTITEDDIAKASATVDNCPLARCGQNVFPYFRVGVDISHIGTFLPDGSPIRLRYRTSTFAGMFDKAIHRIEKGEAETFQDSGIKVGTYKFKAPTPSQSLEAKRPKREKKGQSPRTVKPKNMKEWARGRVNAI